jgi:hypothetical protein
MILLKVHKFVYIMLLNSTAQLVNIKLALSFN